MLKLQKDPFHYFANKYLSKKDIFNFSIVCKQLNFLCQQMRINFAKEKLNRLFGVCLLTEKTETVQDIIQLWREIGGPLSPSRAKGILADLQKIIPDQTAPLQTVWDICKRAEITLRKFENTDFKDVFTFQIPKKVQVGSTSICSKNHITPLQVIASMCLKTQIVTFEFSDRTTNNFYGRFVACQIMDELTLPYLLFWNLQFSETSQRKIVQLILEIFLKEHHSELKVKVLEIDPTIFVKSGFTKQNFVGERLQFNDVGNWPIILKKEELLEYCTLKKEQIENLTADFEEMPWKEIIKKDPILDPRINKIFPRCF